MGSLYRIQHILHQGIEAVGVRLCLLECQVWWFVGFAEEDPRGRTIPKSLESNVSDSNQELSILGLYRTKFGLNKVFQVPVASH